MDSGSMFSIFGYVAGGIFLIVGLLISDAIGKGEGATIRDRILSSPALTPLLIIHYFLPYGLVVLVLFTDIMSQLPQGSIGLLIAIICFYANYFF